MKKKSDIRTSSINQSDDRMIRQVGEYFKKITEKKNAA